VQNRALRDEELRRALDLAHHSPAARSAEEGARLLAASGPSTIAMRRARSSCSTRCRSASPDAPTRCASSCRRRGSADCRRRR
jgi:hypothetical protein